MVGDGVMLYIIYVAYVAWSSVAFNSWSIAYYHWFMTLEGLLLIWQILQLVGDMCISSTISKSIIVVLQVHGEFEPPDGQLGWRICLPW